MIQVIVLVFVLLIAIDSIWLFLMRNFYNKAIGENMKTKPNLWAASLFYVLYSIGVTIFVVNSSESLLQGLLLGFLFGVVAYATYDLTNLTTLKNWSVKMTVIDIAWGGILTSIVSLVTIYLINIL